MLGVVECVCLLAFKPDCIVFYGGHWRQFGQLIVVLKTTYYMCEVTNFAQHQQTTTNWVLLEPEATKLINN